ncbi:MAG: ATP-binding protein [Desulfomonile sp.]|jgi:serine/threonine-protein kinase RsbW
MENELTVRIEVPAEMIMIRPLDVFVRNLIQQLPAFCGTEGLVDNLELAFSEAFTNICRHAYKSERKGPVTIVIRVGSNQLEFRFEDNGESFDPDKVRSPNLDKPCEGGLGIWLMRQVMDEYLYHSEKNGKNVLRLIKHIST